MPACVTVSTTGPVPVVSGSKRAVATGDELLDDGTRQFGLGDLVALAQIIR